MTPGGWGDINNVQDEGEREGEVAPSPARRPGPHTGVTTVGPEAAAERAAWKAATAWGNTSGACVVSD